MNKYLAYGIAAVFLIMGGWWYLNQSSAPATFETTQLPTKQEITSTGSQTSPIPASQSATNRSYTFYTIESLNAQIKIPKSWIFVTSDGSNFVGFRSPDFLGANNGSKDIFPSMEPNNVVSGAAIVLPRSLNEITLATPDKTVSLGGRKGGIIHRITGSDEGSPAYKIDSLVLNRDGSQFIILTLKTSLDFDSEAILEDIISGFKFL